MPIEKWNARYLADPRPGEPEPFVVEWTSTRAPGKALDVAGGLGRHALWLAERGWKVTALDGAEAGIETLRGRTNIEARVVDLEADGFALDGGPYDLVVNTFFLHRPLFAEFHRSMALGGLLLFMQKSEGRFAIGCPELRTLLADWRVLRCGSEHGAVALAATR